MIGIDVPAVGFSIGFERIVDLLMEEGKIDQGHVKIAMIYSEKDALVDVMRSAMKLREEYTAVSVYKAKKKLGKQLAQLQKFGYKGFIIYGEELNVEFFE